MDSSAVLYNHRSVCTDCVLLPVNTQQRCCTQTDTAVGHKDTISNKAGRKTCCAHVNSHPQVGSAQTVQKVLMHTVPRHAAPH